MSLRNKDEKYFINNVFKTKSGTYIASDSVRDFQDILLHLTQNRQDLINGETVFMVDEVHRDPDTGEALTLYINSN